MKARRSLNLLVAAAGLVFLSGCATETLTDSAFWSYLPFTSHKGGKGSGGQGGDAPPANADPAGAGKAQDGAKPTTPAQRSADPASEGWNDPVKPAATAETGKPATASPRNAKEAVGKTPTLPTEVGTLPAKNSPSGLAVSTDLANLPTSKGGQSPTLPAGDGPAPTAKNIGSVNLPNLPGKPTSAAGAQSPGLGDPPAPTATNRAPTNPAASVDLPGPKAKSPRPTLRLPELLVDGIGPTTVGKPTVAELPKRAPAPKPEGTLSVPPVVLREATDGKPGEVTRPLPKALTEAPERRQANSTPLPLPSVAIDSPSATARSAAQAGKLPPPPTAPNAQTGGPTIDVPGAPATPSTASGTLTGGVAVSPLPTKAAGPTKPLPPVEASAPLPIPPIPAPFRLSEWISNDAMHQAWRRQQIERKQLEPQLRGGEQQRLRLLLDTYLLREKPEEKPEK